MGWCIPSFWLLATWLFTLASADDGIHDVAIIGGGSAGTYTAIQLQRLGRSVILVETLGQLGGNVNTYVDPTNNETYDVGVVAYENIPAVTEYLQYLDIPTRSPKTGGSAPQYVDFQTGSPVQINTVPAAQLTAALRAYQSQLSKYPYLVNGYNLPSQVPSDFLLSWGDFVKKYNLQALAYTVSTYNQGIGNILEQSTLSMFKYLNAGELNMLTTGVSVVTAAGSNQHIYDKALAKLGTAALVRSNVTSIRRSSRGVRLTVSTPGGTRTIRARQLVVAIRPTLAALQPFLDLRPDEKSVFAQWNHTYYWCGLVADTGLPRNVSIDNVDPRLPYNIPASPGLYTIGATSLTNNLHSVYYSSPFLQSDQVVQSNVLAAVNRVRKGLGYPAPTGKSRVIYWRAHQPFFLGASTEQIKKGFYTQAESLQGKYRTHWTGAAWQTEDSSVIWNYTRAVIVPQIMKSLATAEPYIE